MAAAEAMGGIFLVLGPARGQWPAPLGALVTSGRVRVEALRGIHEVAARVAGGGGTGGEGTIRGLLLDPCVVTLADLRGLLVIARYVRMPVVMLPLVRGASTRSREAGGCGVIRWEEASGGLMALLGGHTAAVRTDNRAGINADAMAENSVTAAIVNRYDEFSAQPLVSAQEMAALLDVDE